MNAFLVIDIYIDISVYYVNVHTLPKWSLQLRKLAAPAPYRAITRGLPAGGYFVHYRRSIQRIEMVGCERESEDNMDAEQLATVSCTIEQLIWGKECTPATADMDCLAVDRLQKKQRHAEDTIPERAMGLQSLHACLFFAYYLRTCTFRSPHALLISRIA